MVRMMMTMMMMVVMITLRMPYVANELVRSPRNATKAPPTAVFLQPK